MAYARRRNADEPDIYERLTNQIVEKLEQGTIPWQRPWDKLKCGTSLAPFNPVTGTVYKGVNFLTLALDPRTYTTGDPRYCTFKNCIDEGWNVRKGEHGTHLIFYKPLEKGEKEAEDRPHTKFGAVLKAFVVFHSSQIEGMPPYIPPNPPDAPTWDRPRDAQIILDNSRAVIREVGERAYYSPATDHIGLPPLGAFIGPEHWAATALHEMGHWTGAAHRLNRDLSGGFGSAKYSAEEIRVELSSLFVCTTLGLPTDTQNHTAYIGHWLKRLKEDKREIFKAAAEGQRIADFILSFHPGHQPVPSPTLAHGRLSELPRHAVYGDQAEAIQYS